MSKKADKHRDAPRSPDHFYGIHFLNHPWFPKRQGEVRGHGRRLCSAPEKTWCYMHLAS
jgi:hypothetical protein